MTALNADPATQRDWVRQPPQLATSGWKASDLAAAAPAWAASASVHPEVVLVNIGVNDQAQDTTQAVFEAGLASALDTVHAAFPSAVCYVAYPWSIGQGDAKANAMAGWIDTVLAARGPWALPGHDERVWLKGADNGATMTTDGVHYSVAGNAECAAQWQTVLGY